MSPTIYILVGIIVWAVVAQAVLDKILEVMKDG